MKTRTLWMSLGILLLGSASLAARTWTQGATGKQIEADFIRVSGEMVELKLETGRRAEIPVSSLSPEDQLYIQERLATAASSGADWPQWRGPNQDDISPDTGLLQSWPADGPQKLWTYDDAGMGYSGYSFAEGKLFTLGTRGSDLVAIALDPASGNEIWARKVGTDDQQGYNTGWGFGPRSTPTFNEGHLYILDAKGGLYCISAEDGRSVWSKDLVGDFGGEAGGWGFSESPLVDGDKVLIAPGGSKAPIVALDKKTGATIWTSAIEAVGTAEYATILVTEIEGQRQYIKFFQQLLVGVDAEDGSVLWTSEWSQGRTAVIPTPIVDGNQVFITSGYGAGSKLVEVNGSEATDVWENNDMKNQHGGVVKVGDYLYGFSDGAGLVCQSWKTGELAWNQRGQYTSKGSVHAADGMLYCVNEDDGTVVLVEANPAKFVEKGMFRLEPQSAERNPKGKVWTHPVVVGGKLYLRDQQYISCFDVKG